jgi:hypothetical protein
LSLDYAYLQSTNLIEPDLRLSRFGRLDAQPHALILKKIDRLKRLKDSVAINGYDVVHGGTSPVVYFESTSVWATEARLGLCFTTEDTENTEVFL